MALKDLLVYVDQTDGAHLRLRLAADLASRHGGRLTAIFVWEWTPIQLEERSKAEMGLVSAEQLDRLLGIPKRRSAVRQTGCDRRWIPWRASAA